MPPVVARAPIGGRVMARRYTKGRFINASLDKASTDNERLAIRLSRQASDAAADPAPQIAFVLIAGLVAQHPGDVARAVAAAVFLHGLAGDVAAGIMGGRALLATAMLPCLPQGFYRARRAAGGAAGGDGSPSAGRGRGPGFRGGRCGRGGGPGTGPARRGAGG